MLSCLEDWREETASKVFGSDSLYGPEALISDHNLERVARCTLLPSIQQLHRYLTKWPEVDKHLDSMWTALENGGFTSQSDSNAAPPTSQRSNRAHPPSLQTPGASSSSQQAPRPAPNQSATTTQAPKTSY